MINDSSVWFNQVKRKMIRSRLFQKGRRQFLKIKTRLWFYLALFAFVSLLVGFLGLVVAFAWYSKDLPSPTQLVRREGFATRIYDREGKILYDVFREAKRTPVSWEEIPDYLKTATVSVEDKEFYSHPGFSARGIARAVFNIIFRGKLQGGSTLTQQLIKNVLLTSERKISRKVKEFVLALQVEKRYSKDEILLMYLNESPYGGTAWGVGAATEQFFDKPVSELSLVESAILAGLPQRPSVYSPFAKDPTAYIGRTKQVLRRMREDGHITKKEEEEALGQLKEVKFAQNSSLMKAPHFIAWVQKLLEERYGEVIVAQGGLKVTTSLDSSLQEIAEKTVKEQIERVKGLNITNGAVIVLDPETGEVLSLVGSKDYFADDISGKFDVVTQGLRQPGSAIKPITYAAALERGYTAATLLMDTKTVFPVTGQKDYIPVNYDGQFRGPMNIRSALGNSINVPAVKMLGMVGLENMLAKAYEMGINTLAPSSENLRRFGLSVTLGGGEVRLLELAAAYSAFANGGLKKEPVAILKVEDARGNILEEFKPTEGKRVLGSGVAFIINHILSDNQARAITFGENSGLNIAANVAVKTGTSNDKRDNWAIGWSPNVLVGVWVGNNDNSAMKKVASGISGATPIWRTIILAALKTRPKREFLVPDNVVSAEVDRVSGYRSHDGFPAKMEYFVRGTEPTGRDPIHTKLKLCRGQNKLATPAQVGSGDYDEKEFFVFKEEDPISQDGRNRWQEGILAWAGEQIDSRYRPPRDYCEGGGLVEIAIDSPGHHSTQENTFLIKVKVTALKTVKEVKFFIDGEEKKSFSQRPYELEVTLPDGTYTIKATAKDEDGNKAEREAEIGVNLDWDWQPSPSPSPTDALAPTPTTAQTTPTLIPTPTPAVLATPT